MQGFNERTRDFAECNEVSPHLPSRQMGSERISHATIVAIILMIKKLAQHVLRGDFYFITPRLEGSSVKPSGLTPYGETSLTLVEILYSASTSVKSRGFRRSVRSSPNCGLMRYGYLPDATLGTRSTGDRGGSVFGYAYAVTRAII